MRLFSQTCLTGDIIYEFESKHWQSKKPLLPGVREVVDAPSLLEVLKVRLDGAWSKQPNLAEDVSLLMAGGLE